MDIGIFEVFTYLITGPDHFLNLKQVSLLAEDLLQSNSLYSAEVKVNFCFLRTANLLNE